VTGWFARFPAGVESREDTYLVDPQLPGLSVKLRQGKALEVKVYQGSPGILEMAGRARGRLEFWDKWSFPCDPRIRGGADLPGWRPVRKLIRRFSPATVQGGAHLRGLGEEPGCEVELTEVQVPGRAWWTWGSRRPACPACCAQNSRPPPRWCSRRPCPVAWNWAPITPSPTHNGSPTVRTP
jgi:hypothetical protein